MTATEIVNLALGKLGANTITDLGEEELIRPTYQQALAEILRSHNWNFATTRKALPISAGEAPYRAQVPADSLRIVAVLCNGVTLQPREYRAEGGAILSSFQDLTLCYVSGNTAPTTFPPDFIEALATLLASKLAGTLLKSPQLMEALRNAYKVDTLPDAKLNDALESPGAFYADHRSPASTSPANAAHRSGRHPRDYGFSP